MDGDGGGGGEGGSGGGDGGGGEGGGGEGPKKPSTFVATPGVSITKLPRALERVAVSVLLICAALASAMLGVATMTAAMIWREPPTTHRRISDGRTPLPMSLAKLARKKSWAVSSKSETVLPSCIRRKTTGL